jgi:hypothetical protein
MLYKVKKTTIGAIQLDASIEETHTRTNQVTDHPVEEGFNISDHIRPMPESINIKGIISNTPVVFLASKFAKSPIVGDNQRTRNRVKAADDEFLRIMNNGELKDIITSLRTYKDMAVTSYVVNRSAQLGNVLSFDIQLQKVVTAKTQVTKDNLPKDVFNKKAENKGKAKTKTDTSLYPTELTECEFTGG